MSEPVKQSPEESLENTADRQEGVENQEEQDWNSDDEMILMRRKRHKAHSESEGLNLTAMMDMFTIILVFLIKQYASAPENIQLSDVLQPPVSSTKDNIQPAVSIVISRSDILIDGKKVADIKGGRIVAPEGQDPMQPISTELSKIVQRLETLQKRSNGAVTFDGMIMLVVDGDTTYEILNQVLLTAGRNNFSTYKMIVKAGGKQ